ncbi:hypothetical protein HDU96_008145 [Phlyctochytrium bullatum]|nr:hypothetical protein HDU96_008145 [Phlyctochytrium bullatum]
MNVADDMMAGLCSIPPEVLRSILLGVRPNDLITLASANRYLRHAVSACIDYDLARHHLAQFREWHQEILQSIPFEHPLLFEHSVAAISRFRIYPEKVNCIWGDDWQPIGMDAGKERIRLIRVRALRTAVQRRLWPSSESEDTPFDPAESEDDMETLVEAVAMAGYMRSLDLLADLRNAYPDAFADAFPEDILEDLDSDLFKRFFSASAESGFCDALDLIPENHPILNEDNDESVTLLGIATCSLHKPAVELLIAKGAQINPDSEFTVPPLFQVGGESVEILRLLLERGADVHHLGDYGTVVHEAARADDEKALKLFMEFGADPDARDHRGATALFETARKFSLSSNCIHILLDAGADVDAQDNDGRTPLAVACIVGCVDVVRILIDSGANVNHASADSRTPLHYALYGYLSNPKLVEVLLEAGARVNARDRDGKTPLHLAMEREDRRALTAAATALLEAGADPSIKSNAGFTPLGLFRVDVEWKREWEVLLELFIAKGADLLAKTESGETVWQRLCKAGLKNPSLLQWVQQQGGSD